MRFALASGVAGLGAVGSLCRWALATVIQRHGGGAFPMGTFVVNVLGSLVMGAVMGFFIARGTESSAVRVALTAGLMGGFTTYSAFAMETVLLIQRRAFGTAALNVVATVLVCLLACAAGLFAGRAAAH